MDHLEILTSIIWLKKQFDGGLVESVLINYNIRHHSGPNLLQTIAL